MVRRKSEDEESEVAALQRRLKAVTKQIVDAKKDVTSAQEKVAKLEARNADAKKIAQAKKQVVKAQAQVTKLETRKADIEKQISEAS